MSVLVRPGSTVAIVGAGMSGLAAADLLHRAGASVTVFDKGKRVAGRMSTRQTDTGVMFDHGAQYFTVRDPRFESQVTKWIDQGVAAEWRGRIGALSEGDFVPEAGSKRRFVGTPGMNRLCEHMAEGLNVNSDVVISAAIRVGDGWRLMDGQGGRLGQFEVLIVSTPPAQTARLLNFSSTLQQRVRGTRMYACWAAMLAFDEPLGLDFDGAFVDRSPLAWIARNSSKPGRNATPETWVLHGSTDWSERRVDTDAGAVLDALTEAFWDATRVARRPASFAKAHRWRSALPAEPIDKPYLLDAARRVAACGDWCGGPRVEGAYLSGLQLAGRLVRAETPQGTLC